ncbi:hypothetical protein BDF20DRAFT_818763 [Mycotypha africana]|uniref:uncharacterized protein n=1 Tax=Mycotypha africana TaxID=64632 RepID=UPI002301F7C3|nr:uncharacterized protein BDF20DRAFT_818763 [Mycotypha africana]KAI8982348.1 hypothetical protein BDF20DRAFT_818763 [Mycotypha africana]
MTLEELKAFQLQARSVANSLNHLRRSEQFARATEVAVALEGMIRSLHLDSRHHRSSSFFFIMFGLITLGHESLYAPAEVRQQIFYQYKFGRRLILEMSTALKNFESTPAEGYLYWWSSLYEDEDWLSYLQDVCSKLVKYDITWEYRREYQDVVQIAERYFQTQRHHRNIL